MTIGVRPGIDVARFWVASSAWTDTEAGGMAAAAPAGATRGRRSGFRPTKPATTAPAVREPARIMNERRDQSGITAGAAPAAAADERRGAPPERAVAAAPRAGPSSQPR